MERQAGMFLGGRRDFYPDRRGRYIICNFCFGFAVVVRFGMDDL